MADEKNTHTEKAVSEKVASTEVADTKAKKVKDAPVKENFFKRVWKKIKKFFKDINGELKKVVWMPKNELKKSTLLVVVTVVVVSAAIGIVDTLFSKIINLIAGLIG